MKNKKLYYQRIIFLTVVLLVTFSVLSAAWLDNVPKIVTQPDGTRIEVFVSGDEFYLYAHDSDNYTIIQDSETGYWCWAEMNYETDELISSGQPIHLSNNRANNITPGMNISEARYREKRADWDIQMRNRGVRAPTTGIINNLIIFIRFADEADSIWNTDLLFYENMLNARGEGINSFYQYYWDASYQQLEVNSFIYPISNTNTIMSYQSPYSRSYYKVYHAVTNPDGYRPEDRTPRIAELISLAVEYVSHQVSTDIDFDSDNDGRVDNTILVVSGDNEGWAELLWPHRSWLSTVEVYLHGKRIYDYNFNIEEYVLYPDAGGVALFAHEFAHTLGVPDYYRYVVGGSPIGYWDLMAGNTNPPQSMSTFIKHKYLNWITEIPEILNSGVYEIYPNSTHHFNNAFKVSSPNSEYEYFLLEYRNTNVSLTDSTLPGSGLIVYRVNDGLLGGGNSNGPPDELYIYRRGGTLTSEGTLSTAFFSADVGRVAMNDYTNPSSFLSNGDNGGLDIFSIGFANESISFQIEVPNRFNPPRNFTATADSSTVELRWLPPGESFEGLRFSHNSSRYSNSLGSNGTTTYHAAHRYTPEQLADFGVIGSELTKVFLASGTRPGDNGFYEYIINIWQGGYVMGGYYYEGDLVYSDYIGTLPPLQWNEIELLDSVYIEPDMELWIGYTVNIINGGFPMPFDVGPAMDGYGNLFGGSGNWSTMTEMGFFGNWMIAGLALDFGGVKRFGSSPAPPKYQPSVNSISSAFRSSALSDELWQSEIAATRQNLALMMNIGSESGVIDGTHQFPIIDYPLSISLLGYNIYRGNELLNDDPINTLTFIDMNVPNGIYVYKIQAVYNHGESEFIQTEIEVDYEVSDSDETNLLQTVLLGNYPNPFNPNTTIFFTLNTKSHVRLDIYNIRGQRVRTLIDERLDAGNNQINWNGEDDTGRNVSSGIYFYQLQTEDFKDIQKMIMLR